MAVVYGKLHLFWVQRFSSGTLALTNISALSPWPLAFSRTNLQTNPDSLSSVFLRVLSGKRVFSLIGGRP